MEWTMRLKYIVFAVLALPVPGMKCAHAEPARAVVPPEESAGSVGDLLKSGWQIAGYTSTFDNRSSLILFKNPNENFLVQCLTGYDVQRTPRVYENCYRLK
jgi:hypothetical protein